MTLRVELNKRFSSKVYPNIADPNVQEMVHRGRDDFLKLYLGRCFPWVFNGHNLHPAGSTYYATHAPFNREMTVGRFPLFRVGEINLPPILKDVRKAGLRFAEITSWRKRVQLLRTISEVVEERFWLLVAAKQYETGQSLAEAVGETDEEVDFPLAVAMYLEELHGEKLSPSSSGSGQHNGKSYVPHGIFLNICPFNFPGAIPMDMACKALAMGNAFIEKSSDKSSLCGYLVYESIKIAFERMGIDHRGVVNYAPGGAEIVDRLLASPDIAGVSFTGSSEALRQIKEKHRCVLRNGFVGKAPLRFGSEETSGVNIVVVWKDTDLAYAAKECVKSFVGRSGQKCSSARVIMVHEQAKDTFMEHMKREVSNVRFGNVLEGADLGPVITMEAGERILKTIVELTDSKVVSPQSYTKLTFEHSETMDAILPRILFAEKEVHESESLAVKLMNTEIFGPVTTMVSVPDMAAVKRLCKLSNFALTGSCFTEDMDVLIAMTRIIPAGNLYHNRKCTGALVESECFGGLRSASSPSGIKGKAALALFGSMQTVSGFYGSSWSKEKRQEFVRRMEDELGVVFSKT
ncbi:MAG TPA: aldehyde dehydrogenase family protein [Candidatus Paceibacterota bacterium]